MPLKAIVNGKKVISLDLSDEEWKSIRTADIRMDCCGSIGHTRISKLGLKHFYHEKNAECPYRDQEGESDDHRTLKYEIFKICEKLGWKADIEHKAGNWIADVFAEKDRTKIVFEVQLSPQTYEVTVSRTNTYNDNGIICYWLFGQLPNINDGSKDIFMHEVRAGGNTFTCNVNGEIIQLFEFVERALSNQLSAPAIPKKEIKKIGKDNNNASALGNTTSIKERLDSQFTALEDDILEEIILKKATVTPICPLGEDEPTADGILKFKSVKRIDDDHIEYNSCTWDIIGSCATMDEVITMRRKAWNYYHGTLVVDNGSTYTLIARERKAYVSQPKLYDLRKIIA